MANPEYPEVTSTVLFSNRATWSCMLPKGFAVDRWHSVYFVPQETTKQKRERIAKEKMYASWDLHNKRTLTIRDLIQMCKPRHQAYLLRPF